MNTRSTRLGLLWATLALAAGVAGRTPTAAAPAQPPPQRLVVFEGFYTPG